jgi:hypothetical protein
VDAEYGKWRDAEIKRVGLKTQREAEAKLDRHEAEPVVQICDDQRGEVIECKADVAERKIAKGTHSRRKAYFVVPDLPWLNKEEEEADGS